LSNFNYTSVFSTDFRKLLKYQVSRKSVQWVTTDRHTDATKITVALRGFANAPQNSLMRRSCPSIRLWCSITANLPDRFWRKNACLTSSLTKRKWNSMIRRIRGNARKGPKRSRTAFQLTRRFTSVPVDGNVTN